MTVSAYASVVLNNSGLVEGVHCFLIDGDVLLVIIFMKFPVVEYAIDTDVVLAVSVFDIVTVSVASPVKN